MTSFCNRQLLLHVLEAVYLKLFPNFPVSTTNSKLTCENFSFTDKNNQFSCWRSTQQHHAFPVKTKWMAKTRMNSQHIQLTEKRHERGNLQLYTHVKQDKWKLYWELNWAKPHLLNWSRVGVTTAKVSWTSGLNCTTVNNKRFFQRQL